MPLKIIEDPKEFLIVGFGSIDVFHIRNCNRKVLNAYYFIKKQPATFKINYIFNENSCIFQTNKKKKHVEKSSIALHFFQIPLTFDLIVRSGSTFSLKLNLTMLPVHNSTITVRSSESEKEDDIMEIVLTSQTPEKVLGTSTSPWTPL